MAKTRNFLISETIGRQALSLNPSTVGALDYAMRARRYARFAKFVPEWLMCKLPRKYFTKPFDGYIVDFRRIDTNAIKATIPMLESTFDPDCEYEGRLVHSFTKVNDMSFHAAPNPTNLQKALENAIDEGDKWRSGFLVLVAEGNQYRPKDILIWNSSSAKWISLNHSKGNFLKPRIVECRNKFIEDNSYWASLLNKQGVVVRPDCYDDPLSIRISKDGVIWYEFPCRTSDDDSINHIGEDIWVAWNNDIRIDYNRHTHIVRFYSELLSKWFLSYDAMVVAENFVSAGYTITIISSTEYIVHVNKDEYPSLYIQDNKGCHDRFECLKVNEHFRGDVQAFLQQLKGLVQDYHATNPDKTLLFLQSEVLAGAFYDARDCLMTEDGEYLSDYQ